MNKITLPRTPEDILLGIFYFLPESKKEFDSDRENLQTFFYTNKKDYSVLKDLRFKPGTYMRSDELDQAIANLAVTGCIGAKSPRYDTYSVASHLKQAFENSSRLLFNHSELQELERLSLEFQHELMQK